MYGEKIEENEELRLDLVDVKEMYKAQVNKTVWPYDLYCYLFFEHLFNFM